MRLALTVSALALWVGALIPALAIERGTEPVARAAAGGGLLASSPAQPLTFERPSAFERALTASPSATPRLELPSDAFLPVAHRWVARSARPSARALAREASIGDPTGVSRERTRGPPPRA